MEENQAKKSLFMNRLPANHWKTATILISALAVIIIGILSYELYSAKTTVTDTQGNMQQNGQMMPGSSSDGNGQMTPPDANTGATQGEGSTDDSTSSNDSSTDGLSANSDESL
ncbi:hypothetical protein [Listeria ilorinensis]|uniref:hypothetical protein n=1 Tax=Listeria ilorinensis TaxID=2867439 RepID=UPI001EF6E819|nr:hypothetical protein [Listeria ilorinensis]